MIYNKKFLIITIIIIAICGIAAVAAIVYLNSQKQVQPTDTTPQSNSDTPMRIENFSAYPDIDIVTKATIHDAIDRYIAEVPHTSDPVGIIREGSYKKTTDGSITRIVFLVDIASLKRSYKIDLGSDDSTGQQTLYTLCPTAEELIYPPFKCKDDLSEE